MSETAIQRDETPMAKTNEAHLAETDSNRPKSPSNDEKDRKSPLAEDKTESCEAQTTTKSDKANPKLAYSIMNILGKENENTASHSPSAKPKPQKPESTENEAVKGEQAAIDPLKYASSVAPLLLNQLPLFPMNQTTPSSTPSSTPSNGTHASPPSQLNQFLLNPFLAAAAAQSFAGGNAKPAASNEIWPWINMAALSALYGNFDSKFSFNFTLIFVIYLKNERERKGIKIE